MADTFEFTLDEESEKKLFAIMTEFNTEKIPSFTITDKYGHTAEYVKVVRCKDCKYDHACTHDMMRRSVGGGYIHCPVTYCSEGAKKVHAIPTWNRKRNETSTANLRKEE